MNERLFVARAPAGVDTRQLTKRLLVDGMLHPPKWVGTNFFPYVGDTEGRDVLVASNSALVPILRAFQMRRAPDQATSLTSKGIEYRYLKLFRRACAVSKQKHFSFDDLASAITFLSPDHSKYWWPKHPPADFDPMSLAIEGTINVVYAGKEFQDIVYAHKSGRWSDKWLRVTCGNYLPNGHGPLVSSPAQPLESTL